MPNVDLLLGLLLAVVVFTTLAQRLRIAYPVLLVLGGLVLSFVPDLPTINLPPNLVLLLFLPPLLYWESLNISYRDLRANLGPILNLSVGLVLVTIVAVAVVAHHLIPGISWGMAFVLGAVLGPTDEVAVATIAERLSLPTRLLTIIEGESLLNDAFSLVVYGAALAAVTSGSVSLLDSGRQVVVAGLGGITFGLVTGWGVGRFRRWLDSPLTENTTSLLTGYVAYLPADALHLSGVLAVVACGLYLAHQRPRTVSARTRLQNMEMWQMVDFLLNGILFILVGLQLHSILGKLAADPPAVRILHPLAIILTVVLLRIAWVLCFAYLPRLLPTVRRNTRRVLPWQQTAVVSWSGMRGGVSLAAALAVPFVVRGAPFPHRELVIYVTYAVILATLVCQGLTLPPLIRHLGVVGDEREGAEERRARTASAHAGLARLSSLADDGASRELIDDLRSHLLDRKRRYGETAEDARGESRRNWDERVRVRRAVVDAERTAVIALRNRGEISDRVMRRIEAELDLEEVRLDAHDGHQLDPGRDAAKAAGDG